MLIRIATPSDAHALANLTGGVQQLHAESVPSRFKPVTPAMLSELAATYEALTANPGHCFWIATHDDATPAGYLWLEWRDKPESTLTWGASFGYVNHIAVAPVARRLGVGRGLISAAAAATRARGAIGLSLGVHAFNLRAQGFFAAMGFTPMHQDLWMALPV